MCSFKPANVGESTKGQIRGKKSVRKAIEKSVAAEPGKKRSLQDKLKRTKWAGADKTIRKKRPRALQPTEGRRFRTRAKAVVVAPRIKTPKEEAKVVEQLEEVKARVPVDTTELEQSLQEIEDALAIQEAEARRKRRELRNDRDALKRALRDRQLKEEERREEEEALERALEEYHKESG